MHMMHRSYCVTLLLFCFVCLTWKGIFCKVAGEKYSGAAVTVMLGSPKWFQNRFSIMTNQIMVSLPDNWIIQIFYNPGKRMSLEAIQYPGIQKLVAKERIKLTAIPEDMRKNVRKRNLLLSPYFWEHVLAERVLLFGGNSVMCANSPFVLEDFYGYDIVSGLGTAGLSLRSRSAVLELINRKGGVGFSSSASGTEEYIFKTHLNKVAPPEVSAKFGVDPSGKGSLTPLSISGVMSEINDTLRTHYIEYCPEIKMLFPTLHSGSCFGAEPNSLGCFKYLCQRGGLKCDRNLPKEIEFNVESRKRPKHITLSLK